MLPPTSPTPTRWRRAAARVEEELGPIDVWVNNAMVSVFSPVREMTPEEYRRVTEVTYLGYVHGTLAALRRMLPRDRGSIVQVGSALAYRGIPLQSAYCAAKHAIQGFTESLRCELLHDGSRVRVTMVQLPALNTPQFSWVKSRLPRKPQPVPPIFQPEVAAARHRVGGRTTTAASSRSAGRRSRRSSGDKLVPGSADRYLARKGYEAQQYRRARGPAPAATTSGSRCRATTAPTAASTTGRRTAARSSGSPPTGACWRCWAEGWWERFLPTVGWRHEISGDGPGPPRQGDRSPRGDREGDAGEGLGRRQASTCENMAQARLTEEGTVRWVEVCFCWEPLEEERPYWEEYFELVKVQDAHSRRKCRDLDGTEPWACGDCDCTEKLEERMAGWGRPFLEVLREEAGAS